MPVNSFDNYPLTWKPDRASLRRPFYQSLTEELEQKIRSGELAPGTKLPPQRELADYLDINYTTITRVYDICKKKGLLYGITGRGTFVAPHARDNVTITTSSSDPRYIDLGAINAFEEYSGLIEKASKNVIEKGYLRSLFEYSYPLGHPHQRMAGVRWMEQLGVHTDVEHCAIFSGAQNALTVALISLLRPGSCLAVDTFTYPNLIELARLLDITLVPVEGDEEGMLPDRLRRQCEQRHVRAVYLMPSCANPTTVEISPRRRQELAKVIRGSDLLLIEDDIATWMYAENPKRSMFDIIPERSVHICGMTKSLCPGLRIAYMAYGEPLRGAIENGLFNTNIKTSALDAEIIAELILSGDAYQIAGQKRSLAEETCAVYHRVFPDMPFRRISYYQWLPIPQTGSGIEEDLLRNGLRVYHSSRFAAGAGCDTTSSHLRIALCSAGKPDRLEAALRKLRGLLFSDPQPK